MSTSFRDVAASGAVRSTGARIEVERWPTETPLFGVSAVVGVLAWVVLTVTIVGLLYALAIGLFVFIAHVVFVAHVRGNGVRLGPEQFPELDDRVMELSQRMGMTKVPEAYLMQAGGALNALATKFLGSSIVVLFSDLLEACGDDVAARDMIIAHELGHIHAGHLRWRWLILPSFFVPFLAQALSRAREYTADRYGLAGAGNMEGAQVGLAILAAGGKQGPLVNRRALVGQREVLNTGWMTIGQWLSTHPPLAKRLVALDPRLGAGQAVGNAGVVRAFAIIAMALMPFVVGGWLVVAKLPALLQTLQATAASGASLEENAADDFLPMVDFERPDPEVAGAELREAFATVSSFLDSEVAAGRGLPESYDELLTRWQVAYGSTPVPLDPFDGENLGYESTGAGYILWSSGPDAVPGTEDDIVHRPGL